MFRTTSPAQVKAIRWLVLAAALVALGGCAETVSNIPPSVSDMRQPAASDEKDSALRTARAARTAGDLGSAIRIYQKVVANGATDEVKIELGDTLLEGGSPDESSCA